MLKSKNTSSKNVFFFFTRLGKGISFATKLSALMGIGRGIVLGMYLCQMESGAHYNRP